MLHLISGQIPCKISFPFLIKKQTGFNKDYTGWQLSNKDHGASYMTHVERANRSDWHSTDSFPTGTLAPFLSLKHNMIVLIGDAKSTGTARSAATSSGEGL